MNFYMKVDQGTGRHVLKILEQHGVTPQEYLAWKVEMHHIIQENPSRLRQINGSGRQNSYEFAGNFQAKIGQFRAIWEMIVDHTGAYWQLEFDLIPIAVDLYEP